MMFKDLLSNSGKGWDGSRPRGQDRVHLRFIITVDSFKLMLRQLLATQEMYALLLQRRDEGFIPALKLLLKHATARRATANKVSCAVRHPE